MIFALCAERLSGFYEHGQWLTAAQGSSLVANWLARSGRSLAMDERRQLSAISDELARHVAGSLSREAGLHAAHELMEALDPNYHSELAQVMMQACEHRLDAATSVDHP